MRSNRIGMMLLACTVMMPAAELGVSASARHLIRRDRSFFWLEDTVGLLAQGPSRDELEL